MQKLKIEQRKVEELIPYSNNAKIHKEEQITVIADSIKEFGFNNPILLDGESGVIAGHGRLLAAKRLELKEVPTIELSHLSEVQKRAYILADNRTGEVHTGWDFDLLSFELTELKDMEFQYELTGFDDSFLIPDDVEGLTDPDAVPDAPETPVTKLGDIWLCGNHRVMCGDSTSIDAVDKLMDGNKADLLHTDPPYGVSYEGGHNKKKRGGIIADTLEGDNLSGLFYGALTAAIPNTKDGAAFYVWFASGKSIETFAALSKLPLELRTVIQWYKIKSGLGAFMSQYIPNCEPCMYLHKKGKTPAWYGSTTEKTVWELQRKGNNDYHPTQKPIELSERVINNSSKSGDDVLDLFGGSGSTMIACEKTGRNGYLMELDEKYVDVIVKRWQEFTGHEAILESTGEAFNAMAESNE